MFSFEVMAKLKYHDFCCTARCEVSVTKTGVRVREGSLDLLPHLHSAEVSREVGREVGRTSM